MKFPVFRCLATLRWSRLSEQNFRFYKWSPCWVAQNRLTLWSSLPITRPSEFTNSYPGTGARRTSPLELREARQPPAGCVRPLSGRTPLIVPYRFPEPALPWVRLSSCAGNSCGYLARLTAGKWQCSLWIMDGPRRHSRCRSDFVRFCSVDAVCYTGTKCRKQFFSKPIITSASSTAPRFDGSSAPLPRAVLSISM